MPYMPAPLPPTTEAVKGVYSRPVGRSKLSWTNRRVWLLMIVAVLVIVALVVAYFAGF